MIVINKPVEVEIYRGMKFKSDGCGKYMLCESDNKFSLIRLETDTKGYVGTFLFKDLTKEDAEENIQTYVKIFDFKLMEE